MPRSQPETNKPNFALVQRTIGSAGRAEFDWPRRLRAIEKVRRRWKEIAARPLAMSTAALAAMTADSFALDGLCVDPVYQHARPVGNRRAHPMQSHGQARLRNHVAILHGILRRARAGDPLRSADVMRWYTSIATGLSISPTRMSAERIDQLVARINAPQPRLQSALVEIAAAHAHLLSDPIFPSFNGILARLLLVTHLSHSRLPPVMFDPIRDAKLAAALVMPVCAACSNNAPPLWMPRSNFLPRHAP